MTIRIFVALVCITFGTRADAQEAAPDAVRRPAETTPAYPTPPVVEAPPPAPVPPGLQLSPTLVYGRPVPYHMEDRRMWGLAGAGFGIFGGVYTITAISGYSAGNDVLTAPIIGPLIMLGQQESSGCGGCGATTTYAQDRAIAPALIMSAIVQSSGLVMGIVGAVMKRPVRVIDRMPVSLAPAVSSQMMGLSASGRF